MNSSSAPAVPRDRTSLISSASVHTSVVHFPLSQSPPTAQAWPTSHTGQSAPPQSTSVSLPFFISSEHPGPEPPPPWLSPPWLSPPWLEPPPWLAPPPPPSPGMSLRSTDAANWHPTPAATEAPKRKRAALKRLEIVFISTMLRM
jgi:hypothetical protein